MSAIAAVALIGSGTRMLAIRYAMRKQRGDQDETAICLAIKRFRPRETEPVTLLSRLVSVLFPTIDPL